MPPLVALMHKSTECTVHRRVHPRIWTRCCPVRDQRGNLIDALTEEKRFHWSSENCFHNVTTYASRQGGDAVGSWK
jgi:hypothetical protein